MTIPGRGSCCEKRSRHAAASVSLDAVRPGGQARLDGEGAEFVLAGTVFKSPSKPDLKPAGTAIITDIAKSVTVPVVGIGGVTAANVGEVIKAGAGGIAVISAIARSQDPKAAAEELAQALKDAWTNQGESVAKSA